jgi:hypothetical protein
MTLPLPILRLIFSYLDTETLKSCMCLSYDIQKNLFTQSPELLLKLNTLYIDHSFEERISNVESYGSSIRILKMSGVMIRSAKEIQNLLRKLPNLQKLIADSCDIEEDTGPQEVTDPVDMSKLTHLQIQYSNLGQNFVKNLKNCNNLRYLFLDSNGSAPYVTFTGFVSRQSDLKELHLLGINGENVNEFFKNFHSDLVKFKLEKLSLHLMFNLNADLSNFLGFLLTQSDCLKSLQVEGYFQDYHHFPIIFNNFKCLEKLKIEVNVPMGAASLSAIKDCRMLSVNELDVAGELKDLFVFKTLIAIFPNLVKLKCEDLLNFPMKNVLDSLQSLEAVEVGKFRCDAMLDVKLPALKKLEISMCYRNFAKNSWANFAENCPHLQELLIHQMQSPRLTESTRTAFAEVIHVLYKFRKLKFFKIFHLTCHDMLVDDRNVRVPYENPRQFEVFVNVDRKVVLLSRYFAENFVDLAMHLKNIYRDFDTETLSSE